MKLSTLACLAALGLLAPITPAGAAGPTVQPGVQAPAVAPPRVVPATARSGDRRRRSYAFCNRESQKRSLRGGRRRRFLIRCKLGYERQRSPAAVQPAVQPPAAAPMPAPGERKP